MAELGKADFLRRASIEASIYIKKGYLNYIN